MKKRLLGLLPILVIAVCLSGCLGRRMYQTEGADQLTQKAELMMQAWLDENMPGAEVYSCTEVDARTPEAKLYLTDYASGYIQRNGELAEFYAINTVSGAVYLSSLKLKEALAAAAEAYLCETMEIPAEPIEDKAFLCYLMVPVADGEGATRIPGVDFLDLGFPSSVMDPSFDMEAYVRDPSSRFGICVEQAEFQVSEDTDLSVYDLDALELLEEKCAMQIDALTMQNSKQEFRMYTSQHREKTTLREYGPWLETDGFYLNGITRTCEEIWDKETEERSVTDWRFDPETDLVFEKTDDGYRYSCLAGEHAFSIRAYPEAEILKHEYFFVSDASETEKAQTFWQEWSDGSYVLALKEDDSVLWLDGSGRLERKE